MHPLPDFITALTPPSLVALAVAVVSAAAEPAPTQPSCPYLPPSRLCVAHEIASSAAVTATQCERPQLGGPRSLGSLMSGSGDDAAASSISVLPSAWAI